MLEDMTVSERFGTYQHEIYLAGYGGTLPAFTTNPTMLESSARELLEPGPFWYVAGSAGVGSTAEANRAAFDRWKLVPRMLAGSTERDPSPKVLGLALRAPVRGRTTRVRV